MNIGQTYISNTSFTYVNSLLQNPFSTYLLTHQNSLQVRSNFCSCDSLYIVAVDWLTIVPTEGYFEERIDEHDGEQETSVLLHYRPDLVKMEKAGDGDVASGKIKSIVKKIGWMPRHWDRISADTSIGNPKKSTAEKGKRYVEVVGEKITELLVELAQMP
ncbi:MAG: Creatinine amidohydrolase [Bacteroidetes bacterium ADurb.BinA174]|nr:MAG: Creatinine amidohydrolase [Bacteroidetes bacterium ADurb.BinA174]